MTMQKRKKMTLYMKVFFAALISLIQIMPIVVVVVNSFRGNDEISKLMLGFPTKFHFENYAVAWGICICLCKQSDYRFWNCVQCGVACWPGRLWIV